MSTKRKITDSDKRRAPENLRYERDMMCRLAKWLARQMAGEVKPADEHQKMFWNACLEAFLVHARNLIVFLHWHQPDKETHWADVRARQFLTGWEPRSSQDELGPLYERICSYVSHLSYERIGVEDWPVLKIGDALDHELKRFVQEVRAVTPLFDRPWSEPHDLSFPTELDRSVRGATGSVG